MDEQAEKPIDKVLPRARLRRQAPSQKVAIDISQCHGGITRQLGVCGPAE
jgi:hypothetical protein